MGNRMIILQEILKNRKIDFLNCSLPIIWWNFSNSGRMYVTISDKYCILYHHIDNLRIWENILSDSKLYSVSCLAALSSQSVATCCMGRGICVQIIIPLTFKNNFLCAIKHQPKIQGRRILTPPTKTYNYKGR